MMKSGTWTLLVAVALASSVTSTSFARIASMPADPYLGQRPPGQEAIPFAVEFLGADLHCGPVFSRDGKEVYWSLMEGDQHILTSHLSEGGWTTPSEVEFASGPSGADGPAYHEMEFLMPSGEPCLSPDDSRLFFITQKPAAGNYREDIWFVVRGDEGWGVPKQVFDPRSDMSVHWQVSVAGNGNLYFFGRGAGGEGIHVASVADDGYRTPVMLGGEVNGDRGASCPFVAVDESYLIYSMRHRGASGGMDLFVSFRTSEGSWTAGRRLDGLSEDGADEVCATVSRDGAYLFFLRNTRDGLSPHWVSASVLEEYR